MTRVSCSTALVLGLCVLASNDRLPGAAATASAAGDANAYFNTLVSSAAHWKSYSLRDQSQLQTRGNGGFANCNSCSLDVNYDPTHDPYPGRQDGAKVVIPVFVDHDGTRLSAGVSASDTFLPLSAVSGQLVAGRQVRIGLEVITISTKATTGVNVTRGSFGTAPASHAAGSVVEFSNNSLGNQVWLPMGTEDGHTYLTTWDAWYGKELTKDLNGLTNWKTFQFRKDGKTPSLWFEVRTRFDLARSSDDVAQVDGRGYSTFGPNVTRDQPLSPQAGTFTIKPETWVRYWMLLDQRNNDWDRISLWVADENRDAVQIYDRMQFDTTSPSYGKSSIHSFQLEFNTSTDRLRVMRPSFVVYVRNVVMLRDVANPAALLLRPIAGVVPTAPTVTAPPVAPKNLRILGL